jgi:hypothetical protein
MIGEEDGPYEGLPAGMSDGDRDRVLDDGIPEGTIVGNCVGCFVGEFVGFLVGGWGVGKFDGELGDMDALGICEGAASSSSMVGVVNAPSAFGGNDGFEVLVSGLSVGTLLLSSPVTLAPMGIVFCIVIEGGAEGLELGNLGPLFAVVELVVGCCC